MLSAGHWIIGRALALNYNARGQGTNSYTLSITNPSGGTYSYAAGGGGNVTVLGAHDLTPSRVVLMLRWSEPGHDGFESLVVEQGGKIEGAWWENGLPEAGAGEIWG